jgi:sugar transferase EpsL
MRRLRLFDLFKRGMDIIVSAVALLLLSPLLLIVAVLVRMTLGSPVLFRQQRPGLHGRPFTILKFRTLSERRCSTRGHIPDEQRLTNVGNFLRRTSLDELPELVNVIRGEMSLIGPRPLLMEYLALYSPEQARRHDVRPGLTGWAQVNGRNALTWEVKFRLDVWYVDHRTVSLDVRIVARTVCRVVRRSGISHPGVVTMPNFTGSTDREHHS